MLLREADTSGRLVITTFAVYHHNGSGGADGWRRLALEDIGRLRWDPDRGLLELSGFTPGSHLSLHLAGGSRVGAVVEERMSAMRILGARVSLGNGGSALVTARHRPGSAALPAEICWVVLLDADADPTDAATHECVDAAIRDLRARAGL